MTTSVWGASIIDIRSVSLLICRTVSVAVDAIVVVVVDFPLAAPEVEVACATCQFVETIGLYATESLLV